MQPLALALQFLCCTGQLEAVLMGGTEHGSETWGITHGKTQPRRGCLSPGALAFCECCSGK